MAVSLSVKRDFLLGCLHTVLITLLTIIAVTLFLQHQQTLQVVRVSVPIPNLSPAWEGTRLGLIADLHIRSRSDVVRVTRVVHQLNDQKPDLIVIAGDTVDAEVGDAASATPAIEALSALHAPLGVYLVFGNHDEPRARLWRPLLENAGIRVLENKHVRLLKENDSLYLVGLASASFGRLNASMAWKGIPTQATIIATVHEPDAADRLSGRPLALQLSGHSHGGQVRLPFREPRHLPPLGRKYPSGLQQTDTGHLVYTTRGIGTSHIPLRLFARPEITMITLQRGQ